MLRTARILGCAVLVGSALALVSATPAAACDGKACTGDTTPESGEGSIAITVTQTSILPGGTVGDSSSGTGTATVYIPPPCMYYPYMTGAEYYEHVESGEFYANQSPDPSREPAEPYPDYEDYRDDTEGYWWTASCNSGRYADYFGLEHDLSEIGGDFLDFSTDFFDNEYDPQFIEPGDPEPVPDVEIPPEILMLVARDAMDLPDPEPAWNPSRAGDAATFVNLDTWVWMDGSPTTLIVNAAAGGNEATVTATLETLTVSAPDATGDTCAGPGIPWSAEVTDTDDDAVCQVVFNRSSANKVGQVTPVTTETNWTVAWSANGDPQGGLEPQTLTAVTDVPVAEVQTIVTGG